jgi:hypothetical protein
MKRQGLEKVNRNNGKGGSYFSQNWHDYVEYRRAKA